MSKPVTPDYYELLGVDRDADTATIARAYRRVAREAHPDTGGNAGMFRLLQVAYETLTDPERRRSYDKSLDTADTRGDEPVPGPAAEGGGGGHWTFADGTSRSAVVDPAELSWWSDVDPDAAARVTPPYRHGLWAAAAAAAAFVAAACAAVVTSLVAIPYVLAEAVAACCAYRRGRTGTDNPRLEVGAVVVGCPGAAAYLYFGPQVVAPVLAIVSFAAMVAAAVLGHRYGTATRLDEVAGPDAVSMVEYGRPGMGSTEADRTAQRVAADALWLLTALPGARVLHNLSVPGGRGTLDHAVACGHRVALIASRPWDPGAYTWTPHGALLRDGEHFAGGDLPMRDTVTAYASILEDRTEVAGFVLVAPSRPGLVPAATEPGGSVTVGDPHAVVERLGVWFRASGEPDLVDRRLLVQLYEQQVAR